MTAARMRSTNDGAEGTMAAEFGARMLGIHITVAVACQRASAGDWVDYAAEVSRRSRKGPIQP
jgi:hypothetical protein